MAPRRPHVASLSAAATGVNPDLTRVLFVNAGILGMQSFSKYIREAMALDPEIEARHINLSEDPTLGEAYGTVFQEAGAAGLPRIGTNINAIPEMIVDGDSGLLVPPGDPAALARALERLIESPGLRRDFGRAARACVVRQSSPDVYRARLKEIMLSAACRQGSTVVRKHS